MRRYLPWIVAGAAARLVVAIAWQPNPVSDSGFYWDAANALARGDGYLHHGQLTAYWPVGYPAYLAVALAVTGPHLWAAYLLQTVASITIIAMTWLLARRWTADHTTAGLAAAIVASLPVQWAYCGVLLSEPPLTALLLAAIWLLWSRDEDLPWWRVAVGGIVAGAACLFKPQIALIIPLVMLADLPSRAALPRRLLSVLAGALFMAATIVPWSIRNYIVFDEIVPVSTNGGVNLYVGNNPDANGRYVETDRIAAVTSGPGDEVDRDRASGGAALAYVMAHPVSTLLLLPRKLIWFFAPDYGAARGIQQGLPTAPPTTWALMAACVITDLGTMLLVPGLAAWWLRAGRPRIVRAGPVAIAAMVSIHLVFFGGPRFHFPLVPLLAVGLAAAMRGARPGDAASNHAAAST